MADLITRLLGHLKFLNYKSKHLCNLTFCIAKLNIAFYNMLGLLPHWLANLLPTFISALSCSSE